MSTPTYYQQVSRITTHYQPVSRITRHDYRRTHILTEWQNTRFSQNAVMSQGVGWWEYVLVPWIYRQTHTNEVAGLIDQGTMKVGTKIDKITARTG